MPDRLPRLSLLGTLAIDFPPPSAGDIVLAQPKRFALLAYLALARPAGWQRRDAIVALFWPESTQERARRALRDSIYGLRRDLGEWVIEGRGSEEIRLAPTITSDAQDFECAVTSADLDTAIALYQGELLPAFHLGDLPEFGQWLDDTRARFRRAALQAIREQRDAAAAGDVGRAVQLAARAVSLEDDPEDRAHLIALEARAALRPLPRVVVESEPVPAVRRAHPAPDAPTNTPRLRARAAPRWLIFVTLVALVGVWLARATFRPAPSKLSAGVTVILPFTVHGSEDAQYLGDGMVDLLAAKLDGVAGLQVVDPQSLHAALEVGSILTDPASARAIAAQLGASRYVMGSVVAAAGRLQVTAYLYDEQGAEIARADGLAPSDQLFALLDEVARELLAGQLAGSESEVASGAALSTASLPALREYLVGERAMRKGDFESAYSAFARATAIDSAFALAHYRMSSAADWLGRAEDAHVAIRAAARHQTRLTGTDRLLVEARVDFWLGDTREAERRYQRLVALRPTSVEARYELAEVRFHGGPWMGRSLLEAEPVFREVLALMPTHASSLLHLARLAAVRRDTLLVDSLTRVLAAQEPGHARLAELHLLASGLRAGDGRTADARIALDAVDVTSRAMAVDRMAAYTGDRDDALTLALPITADGVPEFPRRAGLEITAHLAAGLGQWTIADSMLARLAAVDPLRAAHSRALAVLGAAARGDTARARTALRAVSAAPTATMLASTWSDLQKFAALREAFFRGALADRLAGEREVANALAQLEASAVGEGDDPLYARHLAGLLRAMNAMGRDNPAAALSALEASWPPPRRTMMVRWAWHHTMVLSRVVRAEALLALGRSEEAAQWATAAVEDIAGTPLLQTRIDRVLEATRSR
jgi:TolB-like protein/Tfp pilus assembly protein PilF